MRVLIVDDDRFLRSLVAEFLERAGLIVIQADDGQQALEQLRRAPLPDLVLLDVLMPVMDGFDTCRRIRRLPDGAHLPILMMTGLNDDVSIHRAYAVGATGFIVKPFNFKLLFYQIRYMKRACEAIDQLDRSQRRLVATQHLAGLGEWDWDLNRNAICWSEQALKIIGGCPNDDRHCLDSLLDRVPAQERKSVSTWFEKLAETCGPLELTHRVLDTDRKERHLRQFIAANETANPGRLYGAVQDITALREAEAQIRRLAYFDSLTALPNRAFFLQMLEQRLRLVKCHESHAQGALLFLDLDNFKTVNDTYGHHIGDLLLDRVAKRLLYTLRSSDILARQANDEERHYIARFGGDEFVALLSDLCSREDASGAAYRLIDALSAPFNLAGHWVTISVSIGIAIFPEDGLCASDLLRNGDLAMYHAKRTGKNTYQFFASSLPAAA